MAFGLALSLLMAIEVAVGDDPDQGEESDRRNDVGFAAGVAEGLGGGILHEVVIQNRWKNEQWKLQQSKPLHGI